MSFFIQNVINAISLGSLFALVALGIALIFGIMQLINFAHGELIVAAGYAMSYLTFRTTVLAWPLVVVITLAVTAALAILMERLAFRPVRGASAATLLITSFALSYGLQNIARIAIAKQGNQEPIIFPKVFSESINVGSLTVQKLDLMTVATTLTLLLALTVFFRKATLGLEMRAAAENFVMARILGVKANMVIGAAFLLSGLLAGVVAIFYLARIGGVLPTTGLTPLLLGVVATVLGGMGSLVGAVIGGYALGLITIMLQAYLPQNVAPFRDAFVYAAVIAILVLRPDGIFVTRRETVRV